MIWIAGGIALVGLYVISKYSKSQSQPFIGPIEPAHLPELEGPVSWKPSEIESLIAEICDEENFNNPRLAIAIAKAESSLNVKAYNPEGSYGLMQLKLATARAFNPVIVSTDDLYDPFNNIRAGVRYIQYLWNKYNDINSTIQAYNLGETKFDAGKTSLDYLRKVLRYYNG